jgi:hypothetical protein
MMTDDEIAVQVFLILADWERVSVRPDGDGWLIAGVFRGAPYAKHTSPSKWPDSPDTPDDPIAAARWLAAHALSKAAFFEAVNDPIDGDRDSDLEGDSHGEPHGKPFEKFDDIVNHGDEPTDFPLATPHESGEESDPVVALPSESVSDAPVEPSHATSFGGGESFPAYPGVAIIPDELGALRNHVRGAISEAKLARMDALGDNSRRDFLANAFKDFQNLRAQSAPVPAHVEAYAQEFMALQNHEDRISDHALRLERAARDADTDMLRAMLADLGRGWPS